MGREYFYTEDYTVLTPAQRAFYEENGYLLVKNLISPELIEEIRQRFVDICDGKIDPGFMFLMKDPSLKNKGVKGEFLINKITDILEDEVFFKHAAHKEIVKIVASIIGQQITAIHSMVINKPPGSDVAASIHPMHQDLHYLPFRPGEKILGTWTAMEHVDENNGGLYVVPGSHKGALYPHDYPKGLKKTFYLGIPGLDHLPKYHIVMEKGDTLFFHPLLLHGSGPNRTKGFRKAISSHYVNSDCEIIKFDGTMQKNIEEFEYFYNRQFKTNLRYLDLIKLRSKLIQGPPGNIQKLNSHM